MFENYEVSDTETTCARVSEANANCPFPPPAYPYMHLYMRLALLHDMEDITSQ